MEKMTVYALGVQPILDQHLICIQQHFDREITIRSHVLTFEVCDFTHTFKKPSFESVFDKISTIISPSEECEVVVIKESNLDFSPIALQIKKVADQYLNQKVLYLDTWHLSDDTFDIVRDLKIVNQ